MLSCADEYIVIAVIAIITWTIWDHFDGRHQPPGPRRIPFFGNMIQAGLAVPIPYIGMYKLCKRYGRHGVTRIKLGFLNAVFINTLYAMKDLYTKDECLSRVAGEEGRARNMNKNLGVAMGVGRPWMEMRRFILKTLKNLGLTKRSAMESTICNEVNIAVEEIKTTLQTSNEGTILIEPEFFSLTTLNVLLWLITGQRCDRADKSSPVYRFLRVGREYLETFSVISGLYNYWPFLIRIAPSLSGFNLAKKLSKSMQDVAREIFNEAKTSGRYKTSQNCFVDEFLAKMDAETNNSQDEKVFTEDQFVVTIMDLIQAGSDTTSGVITYGILALASYPTVQEKFANEIAKNGIPCLSDKEKMFYTQAVILETIRYARVLIFLPRRVLKEFWYKGFLFKKDTILMLSAHNLSMDPNVWHDPQNFRPERFLSKDGSFNKTYADELMLPFGIGKRSCVGEGLARDTLFIMFTTLIKTFKFSILENKPKPSLDPVMGITASAKPFHVIIKPRNINI